MRKLKITLFLMLALFVLSIFLITSRKPLVKTPFAHPVEVKKAVENYRYVSDTLFRTGENVEIILNNEDLKSILKAASHITPYLNSESSLLSDTLKVVGTVDLSKKINNTYINASCVFKNHAKNIIESCKLGSIYLSGFWVKTLVNSAFTLFGQQTLKDIFNQVISQTVFQENKINMSITKHEDLKDKIKHDARKVLNVVNLFKSKEESKIKYAVVLDYLEMLSKDEELNNQRKVSLAKVFNKAFILAKKRSDKGSKVNENTHALFAVASAYGNLRFLEIIQEDKDIYTLYNNRSFRPAHIDNRHDLALHFLYSAIIEQVGSEKIAINIGEIKELFDTNHGGTKFDFTDFAADIAGAKFSKFITSNNKNAVFAQNLLAKAQSESLFFPDISAYPRSVNLRTLEEMLIAQDNQNYAKVIDKINNDINNLPLYK